MAMLNTDLHNGNVKRKMSVDDFIRNLRGIRTYSTLFHIQVLFFRDVTSHGRLIYSTIAKERKLRLVELVNAIVNESATLW